MSVAPKVLNCRVNMTYFVKNYKVLMTYFKSRQIAWKHQRDYTCEYCNSYFLEWSITLNRYFILKPISRDLSSINESLFETEFNQFSVILLVLIKVRLKQSLTFL